MGIFLTLAYLFIIGSVLGWVLELLWRNLTQKHGKWVNPGFCTGPYLPIYGFGLCALFLLASLEQYSLIKNPFGNKTVLFLAMALGMTLIEYAAGLFCLKFLKVRLWDYSGLWGNIQGIICPLFSLFWAILGAIYYFLIHPHILDGLHWLSQNLAFSFFIGLFFGVFIMDVVHSGNLVVKLKRFAEENEVIVRYEALKDHILQTHEKNKTKYRFFRPFREVQPLSEVLKEMQESLEKRIHTNQKGDLRLDNKKTSLLYRVIKWLVWLFYPKMEVVGTKNLPEEPAIIVGNHTQMNGPIAAELYCPGKHYTWCAGQMMHRKEVPEYAFQDFWSQKPKWTHPFYKLLSCIIAPLSVCVFNNANTIGVYHDTRIIGTFKNTVKRLQEGANVVIFPEHDVKHNHIIYDFQDKFIDVAKLYYKRTGKELSFVPLYIAPKLKRMYLGKPIQFCAANPMDEERRRICDYLMNEITEIAVSLPEHTVVPYRNIPKKLYPSNIPKEETHANPNS